MSAAGANNLNKKDSNDIILIIKDIKLYVSVVTLSARDNQKLSKLVSKGFGRLVYWIEYKTKCERYMTNEKIQQINLDTFLSQIVLEPRDYLFYFMQIKAAMFQDLMLENINH